MYVCVSGSKKCYFFCKLFGRTSWMASNSVFIDASMMYLKAIILRIFIAKSWFGWATITKKCIRKPILVNLGTWIFKNFSLVQTVVVPPWEANISKLLTSLFFSLGPPLWKLVRRPCIYQAVSKVQNLRLSSRIVSVLQ